MLKHRFKLSPRVRGNPLSVLAGGHINRSIPTCAGEPGSHREVGVVWGVYPHVCGGTGTASIRLDLLQGLSPRVRGNPAPPHPQIPVAGSIPACAGEPRMA